MDRYSDALVLSEGRYERKEARILKEKEDVIIEINHKSKLKRLNSQWVKKERKE